ncbi:hypothetical protein SAMN04488021_1692 [Paracoccus aminovorans]|uniref:Uncharacterized protein n=2 Tax=Paracoccus aminovorans TaxID=34004 RepID=A0A1I3FDC9_9RHOB|nr:hypothetical protein JCM7685_0611 [Paracoccus aminovorans]SFI09197.1 hypothetical protein SAMN04488021_1692 [Paracoccus aminovorans]
MLLKPVYAKASLGASVSERLVDDMYELYSAHIYDAETDGAQETELLRFARSDESAPHWPLIVPFSPNFVDFDPSRDADQLTQKFYEQAYREFLSGLDAVISSSASTSEPNA